MGEGNALIIIGGIGTLFGGGGYFVWMMLVGIGLNASILSTVGEIPIWLGSLFVLLMVVGIVLLLIGFSMYRRKGICTEAALDLLQDKTGITPLDAATKERLQTVLATKCTYTWRI